MNSTLNVYSNILNRNSYLYWGDTWPKAFGDCGGGSVVGGAGGAFLRFYSDTHPTCYDM